MSRIDREDAEEFTSSLGQVIGGSWRQIALAERMGVPKALGYISTSDWVRDRIGGYVKLSIPERREAVTELLEDGYSGREVAEILGVSEPTVRRDSASNDAPNDEITRDFNDQNSANASNDADDDFEGENYSPKESSHRAKVAFLVRANEAKNFAFYPHDQKADREVIKEAELTRDAWAALVATMKGK